MSNKRIYVVSNKDGDLRLINAANKSQAIRHVATDTISATVACQYDLVKLLGDGVKVEEATANQEQEQLDLGDGA